MALDDGNFCSFCVLENHVKTTIVQKECGEASIMPLSVIILIKKIGYDFKIGIQSDAQEFLYFFLHNLIDSSFGYHKSVEYNMQHKSFIPKVF